MDRYESNRGWDYRDAEGRKNPARNCGLFWTEQKANRKLGHSVQQGAGAISPGNIAKEKRTATKRRTAAISKRSNRTQTTADGKPVAAGFSAVYRKEVRPRAKYYVIHLHREDYPISVMCAFFGVSRSGYYDFVHRLGRPEPDTELGRLLREQQAHVRQTYGYRRMWLWMESQGIHRNPKTVLRAMKKYGVLSEIRRHRKWVQMGQQVHKYENLLNRDFQADRPNAKWVTDISYIHTGQGILYLSMIRDLYDNSIVAYKTGTQQTVNLVLDTIRSAIQAEKVVAGRLQLHSDQGGQYTSQEYFNLTKEYGITPSMSRRGNCYDNAMAENFFSILKTECIYRQKIATFQQARDLVDDFIYFYNHERIQLKTGVAPLTQRHST